MLQRQSDRDRMAELDSLIALEPEPTRRAKRIKVLKGRVPPPIPKPEMIRHGDIEMSRAEWAKRVGISVQGLGLRLRSMPLEQALTPGRFKNGRKPRRANG